ncbi:hypothetical protein SAMN05216199_1917 [Pedococcus cremeus]|uniref:Uncharacterized protein n=1 Tax=Pedococcus cremeus TaxID=587636 RepID=A0A1H9UHP6_9MICO|nr:hypothetical protein [Pedococcus cremeus]SES08704.1 hypothetical protein SAMN05216199_1917 [Pedococcus cremeus]
MQKHQAAPVVVRFRPTRAALLAALAGLVAVAFGLFAPLSAQAGDHSGNGRGGDKPWICHPVEGKGESGAGYNVINPNAHSSHINEQNGAGKHTRKDGRTDTYASGGKDCAQGYPTPTHTKTHHPKPHPTTTCPTTSTTSSTSTTTTSTTTSSTTSSSTTSSSTTSSSTTPSTGATSSSTTSSTPVTPATQTTPPSVAPFQPPSQAPAAPAEAAVVAPAAQAPQQAAVVQNAVPQAATDGADLQPQGAGSTGLQPMLIGAGLLLLLAAGLFSARRTPTS